MKSWFSDRFEIETTMSLEEIIRTLSPKIEPKKRFRTTTDLAPFEGSMSLHGFEITRIIHNRNSFLPVIKGHFMPGNSGMKVVIRMGLDPSVKAVMCVWFGFIGLFCLAFLVGLLVGNTRFSPAQLIPFGMLVIGWVVFSGGFWSEVREQKPMLIEVFKGQETSEQEE